MFDVNHISNSPMAHTSLEFIMRCSWRCISRCLSLHRAMLMLLKPALSKAYNKATSGNIGDHHPSTNVSYVEFRGHYIVSKWRQNSWKIDDITSRCRNSKAPQNSWWLVDGLIWLTHHITLDTLTVYYCLNKFRCLSDTSATYAQVSWPGLLLKSTVKLAR